MEPASLKRLLARFRPVQVFGHPTGAAHANLAGLSLRDLEAPVVQERNADAGERRSDRGRSRLGLLGSQDGQKRSGLREPVGLSHADRARAPLSEGVDDPADQVRRIELA
jgi:hypothetical protein